MLISCYCKYTYVTHMRNVPVMSATPMKIQQTCGKEAPKGMLKSGCLRQVLAEYRYNFLLFYFDGTWKTSC